MDARPTPDAPCRGALCDAFWIDADEVPRCALRRDTRDGACTSLPREVPGTTLPEVTAAFFRSLDLCAAYRQHLAATNDPAMEAILVELDGIEHVELARLEDLGESLYWGTPPAAGGA